MATERTIVNPINNVLYVEPNYIHSQEYYGANGLEMYEMTPDLEDYSIYVQLEVELLGRTINAVNNKYVLSYVSSGNKETVNLMQGSKVPIGEGNYINSLTTNYTDLHLNEMKRLGSSPELFGINSIDISYRNFTVPEVTIEFVDVRGAAVFGQRELYEDRKEIAINENYADDIQNTFFQCFFTFPYPKFTLFIKGFYGEPVSYELTCADFRAKFNSDTGNFSCTAKFVGYMFSFLNDVMLNGLIAAPYSDFIGAEYWNQKKFRIRGFDGGEVETPKLAKLLKIVPTVINDAEHIKKSLPENEEKRNIEATKQGLSDIKDAYVQYAQWIVKVATPHVADGDLKLLITDSRDNVITNAAVILVNSDNGTNGDGNTFLSFFEDSTGNVEGRYRAITELVNDFNSKNDTVKINNLPDNVVSDTFTTRQLLFENENDNTKFVIDKDGSNDRIKEASEPLYNVFRECVDNENNKSAGNVSRYTNYKYGFFYSDNGFYSFINERLEYFTKREKEINEKLDKIVPNAIAEALKFFPTVENMTRIVMAHFETFAYMLFKTGLMIQSETPPRTLETLGVADPDDISDVPGLSEAEKVIPPFPKFTQIVEKDGLKNREEAWIGVYGNKFREVDLVHGILNGIKEVTKIRDSGEFAGGAGSESSLRATMKCPLSTLDLISEKPIYDAFSQNDLADILSLVGVRGIQMISSTNFSGWDEKCDVLGRAEAENLLATDKMSNNLITNLKNQSSDSIISMLKGNNVDNLKPASGIWPWKNATDDTGVISNNGDFNICKVKSVNGEEIFTVPYQALNWDTIKQEVFSSKSSHSNNYFNISAPNLYTDDKNDVFNVDTNITRLKTIAESQMIDIDGIDYYQKKVLDEATYNSDDYEDYLTSNADDIIANNIEGADNLNPCEESCMLPCTSAYAKNMRLFGGGYDMDGFHKENPGDGQQSLLGLIGNGWADVYGNPVKRAGDNGYKEFLADYDTSKHTITEFPGLDEDFEPTTDTSLFGEELYYMQDNDNVKAFMFLCSLGGIYKYEKIIEDEICNKSKTISIIPLASVLYAGGLLWAIKNTDKFKHCDPFKRGSINTNCYNNLNSTLNVRVRRNLINTFEYFVKTGVKNNSRIKGFNSFKGSLELKLRRTDDMNYEKFFNSLGEPEEDSAFFGLDRTWYKTGVFAENDREYDDLLDFFVGELQENFLRSYIAVDEDLGGSTGDYTVGFRLGNRDGAIGVVAATNVGLELCTFTKNTKFFFSDSPSKLSVDEGKLKAFFDGFLNRLKEEKDEDVVNTDVSQADETAITEEVKIAVYRYCKLLYDKWIGGTKEDEFNEMWTVKALFDGTDRTEKYFHFIDAFYNKIGQYIMLNLQKFCEELESSYKSSQYSLLSFMSSFCADNKFNLLCVQNFMEMQKLENMKKMFDCVPYNSGFQPKNHPNFIFQYPYEPSSHLDYGDFYENDSFMINREESTTNKWPEALKSRIANAEDDYHIPAFGVSYGKMYQSYFKDIDVSMENPKVTEQSIMAAFAIISPENVDKSTNSRDNAYLIGQDLFTIYSNNSYTCDVTMMGCAWVQPLMYFVLNNVPMFRGTYMVINVTHSIHQGEMITKFRGVRMANVNTRIAKDFIARGLNDQAEGTVNADINQDTVHENFASTDNDCAYKLFPLTNSENSVDLSDAQNLQLGANEWDSAKLLVATFVSMGYTDVAGAAVAGNVMQETHFIPKYVNQMKKAAHNPGMKGGICQWQGDRLTRLINWDTKAKGIITTPQPMPSFGKQILFIEKECKETSAYKKTLNALKGATSDDKLASATETFRSNYEGGSHAQNRINFAKQILKKYRENPVYNKPPKLAGNGDKHISELANGFVDAVNKTSQASGVNVNVGNDSSKSHDNVLYLQSPGNKDFGKVFDIIINGYGNNVSEVKWVVPKGGNQSSPPVYLITTVAENSSSTKIKVVSEEDMNNEVSDLSFDKNSGMNQDFCKSLYKKYKNNKDQLTKDLTPTPKNIDDLFTMYESEVKDCNEYVNEKTGGSSDNNNASSSNVTTTKNPSSPVIGKEWDLARYIQNLHYWQKHVCQDRKKKPHEIKSNGSCSSCTGAINRALRDTMNFFNGGDMAGNPWELYEKLKRHKDFVEVEGGNISSTKEITFSKGKKQGDICVYWCLSKSVHYHTCSFDGSNWVSDFVQNNCNVYTGSKTTCTMEWHLFRHK